MIASLIISTRNRSKYLNQTLESVAKQTMDQNCFEVIIIDNGSTDNTKEIVNNYDKPMLLKKKNGYTCKKLGMELEIIPVFDVQEYILWRKLYV